MVQSLQWSLQPGWHTPEAGAASCSLTSHTPLLAKQGPATAVALRGYRDAPGFVVAPCPQRRRAVRAVKTEVVVAVVHGTEGTPHSCLSVSLVVGPASGVSGKFSLLIPCEGSKAEVAELLCSEAFQGGHLSFPHECLCLSRGPLLPAAILHLSFMELSADIHPTLNILLEPEQC